MPGFGDRVLFDVRLVVRLHFERGIELDIGDGGNERVLFPLAREELGEGDSVPREDVRDVLEDFVSERAKAGFGHDYVGGGGHEGVDEDFFDEGELFSRTSQS